MIRLLWAAGPRHLLRHPAQLALAVAGLALGVATIVAVDIATASSRRAFALSMEAVNGAATHQIVGGPTGIDEQVYAKLRMQPSPEVHLAPIVEGYVTVGNRTLQLIGIDPLASREFRNRRVGSTAAGISAVQIASPQRWFTEPGTVMMAARTAKELGLSSSQPFKLAIGGVQHSASLLSTLEESQPGLDAVILTDIAQAQEWLGLIGRLSRIDLSVGDEKALTPIREQLPPGVQLTTAAQRSNQSLDMTSAFTVNLQAMSLLALLVSLFLIYSAISFAIVQRRRTLSVLRALGATRSSVLTSVLVEAAIIGVVGAGIGLAAGAFIGKELISLVSRTINDLYFVVAVNEIALPASSIFKALAAGFGVSLIAAALPALEAAGSSPQLSMRRSVLEDRAVSVARWLAIGSVLLAIGCAAIVALSGRSLVAGFVALFFLLLSVAALAPASLRALARWAAQLTGDRSPIARLAFGDIAASLSRTGVAVAALGLAVSAMLGVSIMVESFRESLRGWLEQTMRADIYITAPGPGFSRPERRLDIAVIDALLATQGIAKHTANRAIVVESPRGPVPVNALDLIAESYAGIQITEGDPKRVWPAFEQGSLIVSEPLAWRLQLKVGSQLDLTTAEGNKPFEVAGVYREYGNERGNVLMSHTVYQRLWKDDAITALGLYVSPDTKAATMIPKLREAVAGKQALSIRSNAELRELSMSIFERTFVITRVLYWLTAGVAAIALVSALLAWELERSRELAIVRSLGLTPRGAAALILSQTVFMGFAALMAAIPAGVLTGLLLIEVINRRAFGWQIDLHLHLAQFGNAAMLAITAALVAGLYPAWRTGRAPIATEVREE